MWIKSTLTPSLVAARAEGVSKKRIIDTIAQMISTSSSKINAADLFMQFINREKLGSTGIGHGIAIPHCRFATGSSTYCVCITLDKPVDFDAVDQKPIDLIFAMVVPEDSDDEHLKHLAELASLLQQEAFVTKLRSAKTDAELFNAVMSF